MPIWFELVVVTLVAYGAGLALGWLIWAGPQWRRRNGEGSDE